MATKRKTTDSPNAELIDFLHGEVVSIESFSDWQSFSLELAEYEKNVSRMIHKANAYRKAASSIAKIDHKIESIKDVKGLVGGRDQTIIFINEKKNEFFFKGRNWKKDPRKDRTIFINREN